MTLTGVFNLTRISCNTLFTFFMLYNLRVKKIDIEYDYQYRYLRGGLDRKQCTCNIVSQHVWINRLLIAFILPVLSPWQSLKTYRNQSWKILNFGIMFFKMVLCHRGFQGQPTITYTYVDFSCPVKIIIKQNHQKYPTFWLQYHILFISSLYSRCNILARQKTYITWKDTPRKIIEVMRRIADTFNIFEKFSTTISFNFPYLVIFLAWNFLKPAN